MLLKNYLFHRVSDEKDDQWPPMKPRLFENIIKSLSKKYRIVLLEDVLKDPASYLSTKASYVTISFDDGYKDNIETAAPILKKYDCPASFYIVTNCIDTDTPTWTYLVDFILSNTQKEKIVLPFERIKDEFKELKPLDKTNTSIRKIKPWLKSLSNRDRRAIVDEVILQCNDVVLPKGQMMSWNDIRQLKNNGFYIGSHSHTHPMLASLEMEDEIKSEMTLSRNRINEEIGENPLTIAYPVGSFDERVVRIAKETGYQWGVAVEQHFFKYDPAQLYAISRVELYNEPGWKATLRMKGIISRIKSIWNRG